MRHWTCLWLLLRFTCWVPGGDNFGNSVGACIYYSIDVTHSCLASTVRGNFCWKYYAELFTKLSFRVILFLTQWYYWWCLWNRLYLFIIVSIYINLYSITFQWHHFSKCPIQNRPVSKDCKSTRQTLLSLNPVFINHFHFLNLKMFYNYIAKIYKTSSTTSNLKIQSGIWDSVSP